MEKWNLISLPLVPLADPTPAQLLASIPLADRAKILSIWHYDRCADLANTPGKADGWTSWSSNGTLTSLTDMKDGEAYWVRVTYPFSSNATICGNITWWVWGTKQAMPPSAPVSYPVCEGWNMVGFLGTATNVTPAAYLWNWPDPKPVVYGWDPGCWTVQGWNLIGAGEYLVPGQGYWVAFPAAGSIYVP